MSYSPARELTRSMLPQVIAGKMTLLDIALANNTTVATIRKYVKFVYEDWPDLFEMRYSGENRTVILKRYIYLLTFKIKHGEMTVTQAARIVGISEAYAQSLINEFAPVPVAVTHESRTVKPRNRCAKSVLPVTPEFKRRMKAIFVGRLSLTEYVDRFDILN